MSLTNKKTKNHNSITVDLLTDEQLSQLAKHFTKHFKNPVSKSDVVRMGITALCVLHPAALVDGSPYAKK